MKAKYEKEEWEVAREGDERGKRMTRKQENRERAKRDTRKELRHVQYPSQVQNARRLEKE